MDGSYIKSCSFTNSFLDFWVLRCVTLAHFSQEAMSGKFKARARNWHGDYDDGFAGNYGIICCNYSAFAIGFSEKR